MGTIKDVEQMESGLAEEIAFEKCVGEGGHFFYRTGDVADDHYIVACDRCSAVGNEEPDECDHVQVVTLMRGGDYCLPCYRRYKNPADVLREGPNGICASCGLAVDSGLKVGKVNQ